jgi:response regulator NasT
MSTSAERARNSAPDLQRLALSAAGALRPVVLAPDQLVDRDPSGQFTHAREKWDQDERKAQHVGPVTAREHPDVALVGLGASSEHALELIDKIVRESACPVIALLHAPDPEFVKEASKRGVFAHINDDGVEDWQSSIDIVLRRFAEYHDLEGAFGRRALTERAKGILMERHSIDEAGALQMLREQSRTTNRKLIDLAAAVVDGHRLLPKEPQTPVQP